MNKKEEEELISWVNRILKQYKEILRLGEEIERKFFLSLMRK